MKIRFGSVTLKGAQALRRDMLAYLDGLRDYVVPIDRTGDDVGLWLFDHNLIQWCRRRPSG
jgi:hypothetical protein